MKGFKASLDTTSKIIIGGVLLLLIFLIYQSYKSYYCNNTIYYPLFSSALPAIILILTFLFRPLNYSITDLTISINRPLSPFKINRSEIAKCYVASKDEMSGTIRTFGNGGLFGYTGYFRNAKFGTMLWFATQRKNYVMIEKTNGKKIVITPDEPENFIAALG